MEKIHGTPRHALLFIFFPYFAVWNVAVMDGVPAAIMNHEDKNYILGMVDSPTLEFFY